MGKRLRLNVADLQDDDALRFQFAWYDEDDVWTGDMDEARLSLVRLYSLLVPVMTKDSNPYREDD